MSMRDGLWARAMNLLLAGWLFLSAFAWDHTLAQRVSTAYVGVLAFTSALLAVSFSHVRHVTAALAVWLLVSPLMLPTAHAGTMWNDAVVAALMFAFSCVGREDEPRIALSTR